VEKSGRHATFITGNLERARLAGDLLQVRVQDAFTAVRQLAADSQQFDLILADPPYGEKNTNRRSNSFAQQLLDDPDLPKILNPGGLFVLGHTKRDTLDVPPAWTEIKMLKHGDTVMRFLSCAS
jgi:16S rRNA G966 N2-methylase RsmD